MQCECLSEIKSLDLRCILYSVGFENTNRKFSSTNVLLFNDAGYRDVFDELQQSCSVTVYWKLFFCNCLTLTTTFAFQFNFKQQHYFATAFAKHILLKNCCWRTKVCCCLRFLFRCIVNSCRTFSASNSLTISILSSWDHFYSSCESIQMMRKVIHHLSETLTMRSWWWW